MNDDICVCMYEEKNALNSQLVLFSDAGSYINDDARETFNKMQQRQTHPLFSYNESGSDVGFSLTSRAKKKTKKRQNYYNNIIM